MKSFSFNFLTSLPTLITMSLAVAVMAFFIVYTNAQASEDYECKNYDVTGKPCPRAFPTIIPSPTVKPFPMPSIRPFPSPPPWPTMHPFPEMDFKPKPSMTPHPTLKPTPSVKPSPKVTPTPSITPTPTPSITPSPSPTVTVSPTPIPTKKPHYNNKPFTWVLNANLNNNQLLALQSSRDFSLKSTSSVNVATLDTQHVVAKGDQELSGKGPGLFGQQQQLQVNMLWAFPNLAFRGK